MRLWESEQFSLNFNTGELIRVISDVYFEGINFEQAQLSLVRSNKPWLRLTGRWFRQANQPTVFLEAEQIPVKDKPNRKKDGDDETLEDLVKFAKSVTMDEFLDWLDICEEEYVRSILEKFKLGKLDAYVRTIEGHLKNKYGDEEDYEEDYDSED